MKQSRLAVQECGLFRRAVLFGSHCWSASRARRSRGFLLELFCAAHPLQLRWSSCRRRNAHEQNSLEGKTTEGCADFQRLQVFYTWSHRTNTSQISNTPRVGIRVGDDSSVVELRHSRKALPALTLNNSRKTVGTADWSPTTRTTLIHLSRAHVATDPLLWHRQASLLQT